MATAVYVSPSDVQELLPLGVNWKNLGGQNPTPNLNAMAILQACQMGTRLANGILGQSVQSAVRTEAVQAPGHRCGILPDGTARFIASMSPIIDVLLVQVAYAPPTGSPATFQYTSVPQGAAFAEYNFPADDWQTNVSGGATASQNAILITGGWVNWCNGRLGERVQVTYVNGWPNSSLAATANAGAMSIQVDDVAGWSGGPAIVANLNGAAGEIYDGMQSESIFVTSVTGTTYTNLVTGTPVGPGTLNLMNPLQFTHTPATLSPILVSSMPHPIRWGTGLLVKAIALRQGATVVTGPAGKTTSSHGSADAITDAEAEAHMVLETYRRTSF